MEPSCTASQQSNPDSMDAERGSGDIKAEERDGGAASAATEPQEDHRESVSPAARESGEKNIKTANITLEMLSKGGYYDMPMSRVAQLLGRTEGSFQRVCRGLGILRWPYRVRKSLQEIMAKTEEYLDDGVQEDGMTKAEVLKTLQAHMDDIKGISGNGMDKATKQYRQYIFKVNHKLARKPTKQGQPQDKANMKVKGMLRAASKIQKSQRPSRQHSEGASLSGGPSGDATSGGKGSGAPASDEPASSGTEGSQLTRPQAHRLPFSMPFQPVGSGASSILHQRQRPSTAEEYRRVCRQDDEELLRLCKEMDARLEEAKKALSMQPPPFPHKQLPSVAANPFLQHVMQATLPPPHLMTNPTWPKLPLDQGAAFGGLAGMGGFAGLGGFALMPPQPGLPDRTPYGGGL